MKKFLVGVSCGISLLLAGQVANAQTAEEVVNKHCVACHKAGAAGAPKLDDATAWAPRLATGIDAMLATVKAGKGSMPRMGTCMKCTDDELKAAIDLMTQQVR
ncbi:c-type cytochrome [Marinobacterium lutimaris]|uniref:Cytochrome C oxidase, cbb3-type, subunit III n=1 Tax=Marinobacterium lutimaris TaxID=568106 RepID=A0A1H5UGW4_9GAMM|nr:c-type cytochrome [Marinobacterium lutimaris]SEF74274.1 Cytochrome C oxidase, cbb3-type, subunit III [Marinobacterium lutimaris]